jgi:hypothetical protein
MVEEQAVAFCQHFKKVLARGLDHTGQRGTTCLPGESPQQDCCNVNMIKFREEWVVSKVCGVMLSTALVL